jgi:phosphoserine aminotransferase
MTPSTISTDRIYNFSAGPATLPLPVLEEAQRNLLALPGVGMSVMEISHRSKPFDEIIQGAEADFRALSGLPAHYSVLFLQGGASLQFSMLPMNLLGAGATADYIVTGEWSKKAVKDAKRVGAVQEAASTESESFRRIPRADEIRLSSKPAYVHMTSNNTIYGTQWTSLPDAGDAPLVSDASSDIFSRPIDFTKFGVVYAGAQKNLGPSGVTVVVIRNDLLERSPAALAPMLSYRVQAESKSLYNTPPVFGIYILGLVLKWLLAEGGLPAMGAINERKAGVLYAELDRTSFWRPHAAKDSRSQMNVTFRLPSEDLEKLFVKEATAAGFDGLKGHRSVGGLRASIYNAFPEAGVAALVEFMREFERSRG